MKAERFHQFFRAAFGEEVTPFDYQARLAGGKDGTSCESKLINIPTGCGKTAAVVLAWLWNRVNKQRADWPRRLVYCLPMRTLVEQTRDGAEAWVEKLDLTNKVGLHILMGGEEKTDWDLYPEHDAILIGTQDMLLSRALNRGYGMSRYRWPMQFGLLNSDCLWVLDETQLMGVGVETSAQLDAFRSSSTLSLCLTWWMSATLDEAQLATVDHKKPEIGWPTISLSESDCGLPAVRDRIEARKTLTAAPLALDSATKKDYAKHVAELVTAGHEKDSLTLVVVNRVNRAQAIYSALRKSGVPKERLALIHSRFRPADRERHQALLATSGDRIIIATQAVEAGVDISARLLITELAPWASLVQRFGRCNRGNDGVFFDNAEVIWIDMETAADDLALPYTAEELNAARDGMRQAGSDVGAASLKKVSVPVPRVVRPVLRRKDLLDLFDTTPDLCGNDLDVSRYIRDGDDTDVQVFWREWEGIVPPVQRSAPAREELCSVRIGELRKLLMKLTPKGLNAWRWDFLEKEWTKAAPNKVHPGQTYLVPCKGGGYSADTGWDIQISDAVNSLAPEDAENPEGNDDEPLSETPVWQTIAQHTENVCRELDLLLERLGDVETAPLRTAALWHDAGKAHKAFQAAIRDQIDGEERPLAFKDCHVVAKAPGADKCTAHPGWWQPRKMKGFRHELASALAWLLTAPDDAPERDLIAYLIAAHHGKVRLSIRALPNESTRDGATDELHARGIWHLDELPAAGLPGGATAPVTLDLSFMKMGDGPHGASWLARTIALRDHFGPFRLAYLETLLRVADMRASALATSNA